MGAIPSTIVLTLWWKWLSSESRYRLHMHSNFCSRLLPFKGTENMRTEGVKRRGPHWMTARSG